MTFSTQEGSTLPVGGCVAFGHAIERWGAPAPPTGSLRRS